MNIDVSSLNAPLYTILVNNTNDNFEVSYVPGRIVIGKRSYQAVEGFIVDSCTNQTKDTLYSDMNAGNITVYLAVRNALGAYNMIDFCPAEYTGSHKLQIASAGPSVAVESERDSTPVKTSVADNAAVFGIHKANVETIKTVSMDSDGGHAFNVKASKSSGVFASMGISKTANQPFEKAVEGESKDVLIKAEESAKKERSEEEVFEEQINQLITQKSVTELYTKLLEKWPAIEFKKQYLKTAKSYQAIKEKYSLIF